MVRLIVITGRGEKRTQNWDQDTISKIITHTMLHRNKMRKAYNITSYDIASLTAAWFDPWLFHVNWKKGELFLITYSVCRWIAISSSSNSNVGFLYCCIVHSSNFLIYMTNKSVKGLYAKNCSVTSWLMWDFIENKTDATLTFPLILKINEFHISQKIQVDHQNINCKQNSLSCSNIIVKR